MYRIFTTELRLNYTWHDTWHLIELRLSCVNFQSETDWRSVISILGPLAYEPNTLTTLHHQGWCSDCPVCVFLRLSVSFCVCLSVCLGSSPGVPPTAGPKSAFLTPVHISNYIKKIRHSFFDFWASMATWICVCVYVCVCVCVLVY